MSLLSLEINYSSLDRIETSQNNTPVHCIVLRDYLIQRNRVFSNFSCMFLNPNNFFQFEFLLFKIIRYEKPPGTSSDLSMFE